jgi:hypothetical protein
MLVAVEDDLGLRLVELEIGVGEDEQPAGEGLLYELVRDVHQLLRLGRRGDDEVHGKVAGARQRRRGHRDDAHAGDLGQLPRRLHQQLLRRLRALAPGLRDHAAEAPGGGRYLEDVACLRERMVHVVDLGGEELGLVERRVGGGLHDAEHNALVLGGRELPLGQQIERRHQEDHDGPQREHDGPVLERSRERPRVRFPQAVEAAVDPTGESTLALAGAQQLRSHHRRERERHDAGHDHGPRERERELAEQRAREPALDAHRGVDGRQRDRHGDDGTDQLARRVDGCVEGRLARLDVTLDVLDHDDGIVHDQPDGQHDGEQRQQVDREAGHHHEEDRADERDGDRHDGDQHRADRAQEEEDDEDYDEQGLGQRLQDLVDGVLDVEGRVVRDAGLHPGR